MVCETLQESYQFYEEQNANKSINSVIVLRFGLFLISEDTILRRKIDLGKQIKKGENFSVICLDNKIYASGGFRVGRQK